jgi:hypothetical protein
MNIHKYCAVWGRRVINAARWSSVGAGRDLPHEYRYGNQVSLDHKKFSVNVFNFTPN